jgi:hypothetical protein
MRTFLALMVAGFLLSVVAGCGHDDDGIPDAGTEDAQADDGRAGDVVEDDPETGDDVASEVESDSSEVDDGDAGSEEDGGGAAEIAALAAELYEAPGQACTVTVRLDYLTLVPLGYQVFCGPRATLTEEEARSRAMTDTGFTYLPDTLNPPNPEDEWIFAFPIVDFGSEVAVSADAGLTVFGATTVWAGHGDIRYPSSWRDPVDLGSGCSPAGGIPASRDYDLCGVSSPPPLDIHAPLDVVLQTAVPAAFWSHGAVFDAVVLRYPRTVGGPDPFWAPTSEWIVLVNGGPVE